MNISFKSDDYECGYIAGAKAALNHRGYDDSMVYYTLISMGVCNKYVEYIGKAEREKREELSGIKRNETDI